jgi:hypothetical protein
MQVFAVGRAGRWLGGGSMGIQIGNRRRDDGNGRNAGSLCTRMHVVKWENDRDDSRRTEKAGDIVKHFP